MARNASYIARKYEYANGCIYNPNNYVIYKVEDCGRAIGAGGAKVMKNGKALAFAGIPGNVCNSVEKCIRYADHLVWGDNLKDALQKIKPYLD